MNLSEIMLTSRFIFPSMKVKTLANNKLNVPSELEGDLNIVIFAFQRWHQNLVDEWIKKIEPLKDQNNYKLGVYEFPSLRKANFVYRTMLNSGMRAGIRNQYVFEHTIVLYRDLPELMGLLGIPNRDTIEILLIDKTGKIYWRSRGSYLPDKINELTLVLNKMNS